MDRLLRATALAVVLFAVILAFAIGSRIDQTTIALLGGAVIGIAVAAPSAAIITFVAIRRRTTDSREQSPYPGGLPPSSYWMHGTYLPALPPHLARLNGQWQMHTPYPDPTASNSLPPPQRRFYVIGEAGDAQEIDETSAEAGLDGSDPAQQLF